MDVSHIQRIFNGFTKSHVNIAIKPNRFEESYDVSPKHESMFEQLDDILQECKHAECVAIHTTPVTAKMTVNASVSASTSAPSSSNKERGSQNYLDELFFAFCCIRDPLLTLKNNIRIDASLLLKMKQDILAYIDNTQVKVLDMAKYKYTKKGLREIMGKCLASGHGNNNTDFDWATIRALVVVSVRLLKTPITMLINGEQKETFLLPPSMTEGANEPVALDFRNRKFVMLSDFEVSTSK
jgi:hypothetical protein